MLTAYDIFEIQTSYTSSQITASKAEQALTSAVMYVTDVEPMKVTFLTTESAADYSAIKSLVEQNGYDVEEVNPATAEIDGDSKFVILPAPLNDYSGAMIEKLDAYLYNDGNLDKNLMYLASIQQNDTPNINEFLKEWGIEVSDGYVFDTDANNMQRVILYSLGNYGSGLMGNVAEEEYSAGLSTKSLPLIIPYSKPLTAMFETRDTRTVCNTNQLLSDSSCCSDDATAKILTLSLKKRAFKHLHFWATVFIENEDTLVRLLLFSERHQCLTKE